MRIYIVKAAHEADFVCLAESSEQCCLKMKNYGYYQDWSMDEFQLFFDSCEMQILDPDGDILDPDGW
jgi:hypothetical protein